VGKEGAAGKPVALGKQWVLGGREGGGVNDALIF